MMPDNPAFRALGMPPPPDEKLAPKPMPTLSAADHCIDAAGFEEGMAPASPPLFLLKPFMEEGRGEKRGWVSSIIG